jgi:hypothetical protein
MEELPMTSTNEHTGSRLVSKPTTKEYEDNYDRIFRNNVKKTLKREGCPCHDLNEYPDNSRDELSNDNSSY